MTREAFIEELERNRYSYEVVGDKIVVTKGNYRGNVHLGLLQTIPPEVEFKNEGSVFLESLQTIPSGVVFRNRGGVDLDLLQTIPPGVKFENRGSVYLDSLIGNWFPVWKGNITRIEPNSILNKMIADGLFDRR